MPVITLLTMAIITWGINGSRFLRDYRATRLPRVAVLVIFAVGPLVLLDHRCLPLGLHLAWLVLFTIGGLACFIDLEHRLLPDRLILPAIALSLPLIATTQNVLPSLFGGLAWSASFALLAIINPNGLGWGDVKFACLLGIDCAAIGFKLVPTAILVAFLMGGIYSLLLMGKGERKVQVAFGPFMFIGAILSLATP
jgi:leader peptidase (prepilin peptidase)/N-methyltransferase